MMWCYWNHFFNLWIVALLHFLLLLSFFANISTKFWEMLQPHLDPSNLAFHFHYFLYLLYYYQHYFYYLFNFTHCFYFIIITMWLRHLFSFFVNIFIKFWEMLPPLQDLPNLAFLLYFLIFHFNYDQLFNIIINLIFFNFFLIFYFAQMFNYFIIN